MIGARTLSIATNPRGVALIATAFIVLMSAASAAPAFATAEGPGWELTARTFPTHVEPGGRATIILRVFNVGAAATTGRFAVTDTLPPGVTAREAGEIDGLGNSHSGEAPVIQHALWDCFGNGPGGHVEGATVVTCENDPEHLPEYPGGGGVPYMDGSGATGANKLPIIGISVDVPNEAGELANHATVAGGGAPTPASTENPVVLSRAPVPFGFVGWDGWFSNADGTLDTDAGSHPYEATFAFDLGIGLSRNRSGEVVSAYPAGGEARDLEVKLPPGLVVNATAVPECSRSQLDGELCPEASQVGVVGVYVANVGELGMPVYNLIPPVGTPAELGFNFSGILNFIDGSVRTGGDDGISSTTRNLSQREVIGGVITLWNVPGEASHNLWRLGRLGGCSPQEIYEITNPHCAGMAQPIQTPLLTVPTSCNGDVTADISANTWQDSAVKSEASFTYHDANGFAAPFSGCEELGFGPLITTSPDSSDADTPAGLTVEVKPPIGGLERPEGRGTSDIENTTVTLPEGFVINPGQAAGLQACSREQAGLTTEAEKTKGEENDGPADCPNASKVGTASIKTPLVEGAAEKEFQGNVFVLQSDPPELKLLVAASADGINLKLVGVVHLNQRTGQLTTTFEGTPELPFTVFKLSFSGGAQAALATPTQCGAYTTTADFGPWSSPFVADFDTTASFGMTAGPGGAPCPSAPLPFTPALTAGSTTDQAGGFTDFSLLLQRGDGQQRIDGLQFKAPAGLTGELSKVPLCTNPQAESNTCPAASKIGHTVVESGPGPYPLVVPEPGQEPAPIYLTESYDGAPFGLSIVVPLNVGPFTLPTQRVRAKIEIDPLTTQLTITTNELPQVVSGVPTDLREIDAVIEHPEFMVNPTSCNPQSFSGTAYGTPPPGVGGPGATAAISSPFGVGSCRSLEFAPKLSASTSGRTSKADGASLTYKVTYPNVPQGTDADVQYVKVELPGELPSRLTTLQKACTAKVFEANAAGCPKESVIGYAVVHTQLLPVPLEGPVYFVSNGGEAFPNLVMVLQGDGVTIQLVGDTLIKNGVTSTTFKAVPDDPFTSFEITLPEGPYSALTANGNLCKPTVIKTVKKKVRAQVKGKTKTVTRKVKEQVATTLTIPSDYIGQNGATYDANVPISVTGCPKAKPAGKVTKKKARSKRKKK
jgi:hypothetical protein